MTPQSEKLKQATSFFGEERMAKFENLVITETKKNKTSITDKLKMSILILLLTYTTIITLLYFKNTNTENISEQPATINLPTTQTSDAVQPPIISNNTSDVVVSRNPTTYLNNTIKLKVQKGENLTTITNKLIKSNKVKNTTENRQLVMSALKNINEIQEPGQIIKEGSTLLALSKKEIKQICKN